jgi:hypothetical protein
MSMSSDPTLNKVMIPSGGVVVLDGTAGTKFTRMYIQGLPAICIENAGLNKQVIITADVLKGINGWLAKLVAEDNKKSRH